MLSSWGGRRRMLDGYRRAVANLFRDYMSDALLCLLCRHHNKSASLFCFYSLTALYLLSFHLFLHLFGGKLRRKNCVMLLGTRWLPSKPLHFPQSIEMYSFVTKRKKGRGCGGNCLRHGYKARPKNPHFRRPGEILWPECEAINEQLNDLETKITALNLCSVTSEFVTFKALRLTRGIEIAHQRFIHWEMREQGSGVVVHVE